MRPSLAMVWLVLSWALVSWAGGDPSSGTDPQGLPPKLRAKDGAEMTLVPEGTFPIGRLSELSRTYPLTLDPRLPVREPIREKSGGEVLFLLRLPPFYLDRFEVTNGLYEAFLKATARRPPKWMQDPRFSGVRRPVVGVSWRDAEAYCQWAGKRLPTELEWEKAARGPQWRFTPWGGVGEHDSFPLPNPRDRANFNLLLPLLNEFSGTDFGADGFHYTAPVGSFPKGASPYGIEDLFGNVWEWVSDFYVFPPHDPRPIPRNYSDLRVLKGASWINFWRRLSISDRRWAPADLGGDFTVGFRCALTP